MKKTTATSLIATIAALNRALSRTPIDEQHHDPEHDQDRREVDEACPAVGVRRPRSSRPADAMPKPARIRWK